MSTTKQISNGPSKFDIMAALFVFQPERPTVKFSLANGVVFQATVNSISAEDGSGERWIIEGFCKIIDPPRSESLRMKLYFSTSERKGYVMNMA